MKTLLAITTYNQIKFTKLCIESLKNINIPGLDIIFIDDVSKDGTVKYLTESKYLFKGRGTPKGLTYSWNIAYKKFKNEKYQNLIISNNDVLFSKQSLEDLIKNLHQFTFVVPLTTKKGAGHNWQEQAINQYYPGLVRLAEQSQSYLKVQQKLIQLGSKTKQYHKTLKRFNGFIFGMNRNIIKYEFDKDNLFNPRNTNVGQEADLGRRLKEPIILSLTSFIYHFKGVSFPKKGKSINGDDIRQNLNLYHD